MADLPGGHASSLDEIFDPEALDAAFTAREPAREEVIATSLPKTGAPFHVASSQVSDPRLESAGHAGGVLAPMAPPPPKLPATGVRAATMAELEQPEQQRAVKSMPSASEPAA